MKRVVMLCLFFTLLKGDKCPKKVLKIATSGVKDYFENYYKNVGKLNIKCEYNHDNNLFNLEHNIKANVTYKKRSLNFEIKTHSSMFNLYDFSDIDGKICHKKFGNEKRNRDEDLIKKSFFNKFAKKLNVQNLRKTEKKGQICYTAIIKKKKNALI